jgi:hypothetical protein
VLRDELLVRIEILGRDADQRRVQVPDLLRALAVGAELPRADRREVARVEQQHDPLAAMVGETERACGALELEVGSRVAHLWSSCHR